MKKLTAETIRRKGMYKENGHKGAKLKTYYLCGFTVIKQQVFLCGFAALR
jgi:hypothetical protein